MAPEITPQKPSLQLGARGILQALFGLIAAAAIIIWGVPLVAQTTWPKIGERLAVLSWPDALQLASLMVLSLWCYTFAITGSVPGLSHSKALITNLAGSAASNLLPAGGAMGMGATFIILRSWGHSYAVTSASVIITGVWNTVARVALPLLGIAVLSTTNGELPSQARQAALIGGGTGLAVLITFILILINKRATAATGRWAQKNLRGILRKINPGRDWDSVNLETALTSQRAQLAHITLRSWPHLTFGVVGMLGVQFLLFWRIMAIVGITIQTAYIFAAYAIGRMLSAVGITPGGMGITEAGTVVALVAWGADKPSAAAGALLFTLFSQILEVPLGGIAFAAWTMTDRTGPKTTFKKIELR